MKKQSVDNQPIKAVEMVRRIRDAHYEQFKDRPIEERLAYYRERARTFEETQHIGRSSSQESA